MGGVETIAATVPLIRGSSAGRNPTSGSVREGLRVIADLPSCDWIVFLGEQADILRRL
jgi:hypothetical protein